MPEYTKEQLLQVLREMEQTQLVDMIVDQLLPYVPAKARQEAMHEMITSDEQCEQTVIAFVNKCKELTSDQVYFAFDEDDGFLRNDVFRYVQIIMGVKTQEMPEPTRQTMVQLGLKFGVKSLLNY